MGVRGPQTCPPPPGREGGSVREGRKGGLNPASTACTVGWNLLPLSFPTLGPCPARDLSPERSHVCSILLHPQGPGRVMKSKRKPPACFQGHVPLPRYVQLRPRPAPSFPSCRLY